MGAVNGRYGEALRRRRRRGRMLPLLIWGFYWGAVLGHPHDELGEESGRLPDFFWW